MEFVAKTLVPPPPSSSNTYTYSFLLLYSNHTTVHRYSTPESATTYHHHATFTAEKGREGGSPKAMVAQAGKNQTKPVPMLMLCCSAPEVVMSKPIRFLSLLLLASLSRIQLRLRVQSKLIQDKKDYGASIAKELKRRGSLLHCSYGLLPYGTERSHVLYYWAYVWRRANGSRYCSDGAKYVSKCTAVERGKGEKEEYEIRRAYSVPLWSIRTQTSMHAPHPAHLRVHTVGAMDTSHDMTPNNGGAAGFIAMIRVQYSTQGGKVVDRPVLFKLIGGTWGEAICQQKPKKIHAY